MAGPETLANQVLTDFISPIYFHIAVITSLNYLESFLAF